MKKKEEYTTEATRILESLMARKGISLKELHQKLSENGARGGYKALSNKINKGKFQFSFFLECMDLLNIETIHTKKI